MTVVLAGVGADTTNLGALGRLYEDGTFEYIPIPEKTRETDETETLGSWELPTGAVAADRTTRITPRPAREPDVTIPAPDHREWPLHRDPNFEALTYGEHRPGYVERLATLEPGDAVCFYAGLRCPDGRAHRYAIGHMTVASVTVVPPGDPEGRLAEHPANAHAKRTRGGQPFLEKRLVVVDGDAGGLYESDPPRLSTYDEGGYRLAPGVADALAVVDDRRHLGFKPALTCAIDPATLEESF